MSKSGLRRELRRVTKAEKSYCCVCWLFFLLALSRGRLQGNDIALALYEGMGFELAALEDEMLARKRRRPSRVYLSKPLY